MKYYWRALQICGTHKGAVAGACRALRTLGQRSRVLQLMARWQHIERSSKGGESLPYIGLHLYLRSYQFHAELSNRPIPTSKEYTTTSCTVLSSSSSSTNTKICLVSIILYYYYSAT